MFAFVLKSATLHLHSLSKTVLFSHKSTEISFPHNISITKVFQADTKSLGGMHTLCEMKILNAILQ